MASSKDIVQSIYRAFAAGDVAAAFGHMDAEIEWTEAAGFPYAGTFRGHDAVIEGVFKKLGSEWQNWRAVPEEFIAEGGTVVVLGEYSGTCVATGLSFAAPFVHVWNFGGEKIKTFVQHTDTLLVNQAMKAG